MKSTLLVDGPAPVHLLVLDDGDEVPLTGVRHAFRYDDGTRRLAGGEFTLLDAGGGERRFTFERVCEPVHPEGFGYARGWSDGGNPGVWRGPEAVESSSFDATDPDAVLRNDIIELAAPLPSFVNGRVVLVGDAAHAMTPNLGQGGNLAIEDAVTLARLVTDPAGVPAALARYDAERRGRTASHDAGA